MPTALLEVQRTLTELLSSPENQVILLGDFNLHHPSWGGVHSSTDLHAGKLIEITHQHSLDLLLPPGEITWQRGRSKTTIDLTFSSPQITQRVISCQAKPEWSNKKDHNPIQLVLDMRVQRRVKKERFAIKKLQRKKFSQHLLTQLYEHKLLPEGFSVSEAGDIEPPANCELEIAADPVEIDRVAQILPRILLETLEISCPKAKPSNFTRKT